MKTPIEQLLDRVEWTEINIDPDPESPGLYATHVGLLNIAGVELPVFILNNGERVFDADAVKEWLSGDA